MSFVVDVYKRQMEYFKSEVMEMCHREGLYQIDLLNGSKAVSYTHLDVYKRQAVRRDTPMCEERQTHSDRILTA